MRAHSDICCYLVVQPGSGLRLGRAVWSAVVMVVDFFFLGDVGRACEVTPTGVAEGVVCHVEFFCRVGGGVCVALIERVGQQSGCCCKPFCGGLDSSGHSIAATAMRALRIRPDQFLSILGDAPVRLVAMPWKPTLSMWVRASTPAVRTASSMLGSPC